MTEIVAESKSYSDYTQHLSAMAVQWDRIGEWLIVGSFTIQPGWVFYISVAKVDMANAIEKIIPWCISKKLPVCIPADAILHVNILNGGLGYHMIGRVFCIQVTHSNEANTLANELIGLTKGLRGPANPTHQQLSDVVAANFAQPPFLNDSERSDLSAVEVVWPFEILPINNKKLNSKWISGKYLLMNILKADPKGTVYKALNLKNWLNVKWCVVKEAKRYHCLDHAGRDIRARLKWQYEVQCSLSGLGIIPEPIAYIETPDRDYFVMQLIEGTSYHQYLSRVMGGVRFAHLAHDRKVRLINSLLQLTGLVSSFHSRGLLHRDLSPLNFMVTEEDRIVTIDLELSYRPASDIPSPAFTLGTEGYMSKDQRSMRGPTAADDIYGLGGLFIRTITGLSAMKFERCGSETELASRLCYFTGDEQLSDLIAKCRAEDASGRPSLEKIKSVLQNYIVNSPLLGNSKNCSEQIFNIRQLTARAINGFAHYPLLGNKSLWYAQAKEKEYMVPNSTVYKCYAEINGGISGILYTLLQAEIAGFDLTGLQSVIDGNLSWLQSDISGKSCDITGPAGLFSGYTGVAVVFASMVRDGWLENNLSNYDLIAGMLKLHSGYLNLADGIAGKGLAMMKCAELLNFPAFSNDIQLIINELIAKQHKKGFWPATPNDRRGARHASTGLFHGTAGMAYFLLVAGHKYSMPAASKAAKNALQWLLGIITWDNGRCHITANTWNQATDPWLEHGFTGIAFVFIKAFEYFGNADYKIIATGLLENHPVHITSNYIDWSNGLAGLGEVYLEAYRVFGDQQWLYRAQEIAYFLSQTTCTYTEQQHINWLNGDEIKPTVDFMTGQSGILHFLLRINHTDKLQFPFIHFEP